MASFSGARVSMAGRRDPYPNIRPAGKTSGTDEMGDSTAGLCITTSVRPRDFYGNPKDPSPPRRGPRDAGLSRAFDPQQTFGIRSVKGASAQGCLVTQSSTMAARREAIAEANYATSKREPLGRSFSRGMTLPKGAAEGEYAFGTKKPSELVEEYAKDAIWPRDSPEDSEQVRNQYRITHGAYEPGEVASRHYVWPSGIDPERTAFGGNRRPRDRVLGEEAKECMRGYTDDSSYPRTRIVRKSDAERRLLVNDEVGASRKYVGGGTLDAMRALGKPFGKPSGEDEVSAGQTVAGFYEPKDQLPDPSVGRGVIPGRTNLWPDPSFAFGEPSIRHDLNRKPETRSIADRRNLGDEVGAGALLTPTEFAKIGLPQSAFTQLRSREELRDIVTSAGFYSIRFDSIFDASSGGTEESTLADFLAASEEDLVHRCVANHGNS